MPLAAKASTTSLADIFRLAFKSRRISSDLLTPSFFVLAMSTTPWMLEMGLGGDRPTRIKVNPIGLSRNDAHPTVIRQQEPRPRALRALPRLRLGAVRAGPRA